GEYALTTFTLEQAAAGDGTTRVTLVAGTPVGGFQPPRQQVTVHLYAPGQVQQVLVNGQRTPWTPGPAGSVVVTVPAPGAAGFTVEATVAV
nr:hypothetical protein [Bacillota bacterium]